MEIFGIEFAPLNVPLKRRIQTLAAAAWIVTGFTGGFVGFFLSIYLVLFTCWRWPTMIYLIWMWIDRNTSERGGRRSSWVRNWTWWKVFKEYFPLNFEHMPRVQLDPKRNYLFCCFPHGILSASLFSAVATNAGGFHELFPHHTPFLLTLKYAYLMPFFRELGFAVGGCDASANSINHILGKSDGGNVAVLIVGGTSEQFYSRPRNYRLVLKNRRGFVKLALKNGTPLVPVISFGETDLYDQVANPEGSCVRNFQEWLKKRTGLALMLPIGRGFFQYTYGLIPRRTPVTTLVGYPIEVEKIESPTTQQIEDLHSKFVKELVRLFEDQKHRYIKDADDVHLDIQ